MKFHYFGILGMFAVLTFISWNYFGIIFIANLILLYEILNKIQGKNFGYRFLFTLPLFIILNVFATFWLFTVDASNSVITYITNSVLMTLSFVSISYLNTNRISNKFMLIFIWPLSEWLLTKWDLAWPWLTFGNVLANQWFLVQWYSVTGIYGGTAWLIGIALVIHLIITSDNNKRYYRFLFILLVAPLVSVFSYLMLNEKVYKTENIACFIPSKKDINKSCYDKTKIIVKYIEANKTKKEITVITPELFYSTSSTDLKYSEASYLLTYFLNKHNCKILLGSEILNDTVNKFNGIAYIDKTKYLFRTKKKYVPITEYTPGVLTFFFGRSNYLKNTVDDASEIKADIHSFPFVCYEVLFSAFIADKSIDTDKLILLTSEEFMNNSSYGRKQYLDIVRLRAIENNRYLLKCSYQGKSVLISPKGDILRVLNTHYESVKVPLKSKNTLYQLCIKMMHKF